MKTVWIVIVVGVVLMLIASRMSETPFEESKRLDKQKYGNAAAECWREYERKSITANEKVGIAKMCEGLEKTRDSF